MRIKVFVPVLLLTLLVCSGYSQTDRGDGSTPASVQQSLDPMANISVELTSISRSVRQLNERLQAFVDKFEKVGGLSLTEKQQRFIMGLEILVRSEQRVAILQKAQTELIEKQVQVRARLTQIELDLRPQSIERTTQLEGSTQTVEIRESRREKLLSEHRSMQLLLQQVERNIAEAEAALREAMAHVNRLRRSLLPQIEREIGESSF
jgi:hypothetical protein